MTNGIWLSAFWRYYNQYRKGGLSITEARRHARKDAHNWWTYINMYK